MSCPTCNGPTVWQGTLARGRMTCRACEEPDSDETTFVFPHGQVSLVLARYYAEVKGFHRKWCASRAPGNSRPGIKSDPALCDCGFDKTTTLTHTEIERRELDSYGAIKTP